MLYPNKLLIRGVNPVRPTPVSFSRSQRALHWIMALLILFNLLFSDDLVRWGVLYYGNKPIPDDVQLSANIHAYVGIAVLILALIRLALRFIQGVPPEPAGEPAIFRLLSKVAHWTFYLMFIVMPLAGIAGYYFDSGAAALAHANQMKLVMWFLIITHIAAVAVHQFYWKTGILKRMTTG